MLRPSQPAASAQPRPWRPPTRSATADRVHDAPRAPRGTTDLDRSIGGTDMLVSKRIVRRLLGACSLSLLACANPEPGAPEVETVGERAEALTTDVAVI